MNNDADISEDEDDGSLTKSQIQFLEETLENFVNNFQNKNDQK